MSVVRLLARPMLASIFVTSGLDAAMKPEPRADKAADIAPRIARAVPVPLPEDPVMLVRLNGAVQVGAGLLLATGKLPRLSALVLAATLVPTTYVGHPFWSHDDKQAKAQQRIHFFKNVSILGGLLMTAADPGSKGSLAHRASDVAHRATHKVHT